MKDKTTLIEPLVEMAEEYAKKSFSLIKLKAIDKIAVYISTFASRCFALLSVFVFILIASIGLAMWIGELLEKSYYGFYVVAGFYGILGFVLFFFAHNWIKKRVSNLIVSQILN